MSKLEVLLESPVGQSRQETVFDIPLDFYPFVVLIDQGLIVGLKQQLSLNKTLLISQFGCEITTHLFVHLILKKFLMRDQQNQALSFSRKYQDLEYFNHALEIMLHEALETDSDRPKGATTDLMLPKITAFVHTFPKALEIIVNCARKSEMALWKYYFSVAGDPKLLYHKSLENGAFSIATSYLIIIQTLEPVQVSSKLAVQLLEQTLVADDYETGSELYRFLRSIYDAESSPDPNL